MNVWAATCAVASEMRRTKLLTLSAALTALIVVLMLLGSLVEVLDLVTLFIASLFLVFAVIEFGGVWPWLIYATASVIAFLLVPNPYVSCEFTVVVGLLPMLKNYIEKLPRAIAWLLKIISFNLLFSAAVVIFFTLLGMPFEDINLFGLVIHRYVVPVVLVVLGNICFICYDILLTRMIALYYAKYRDRVKRRLRL